MSKIKKPMALLLSVLMLITALPLAALPSFADDSGAAVPEIINTTGDLTGLPICSGPIVCNTDVNVTKPIYFVLDFACRNSDQEISGSGIMPYSLDYEIYVTGVGWVSNCAPMSSDEPGDDFEKAVVYISQAAIDAAGGTLRFEFKVRAKKFPNVSVNQLGQVYSFTLTGYTAADAENDDPCPHCGGTGRETADVPCSVCSGTGKNGTIITCPYCGGSGTTDITVSCEFCEGRGCDKCGDIGKWHEFAICGRCGGAEKVSVNSLLRTGSSLLLGTQNGSPVKWAIGGDGKTGMSVPKGCIAIVSDSPAARDVPFCTEGTPNASNAYASSNLKTVVESAVTFTENEEIMLRARTLAGNQNSGADCSGVAGDPVTADVWAPTTKDADDLAAVELSTIFSDYWLCSPGSEPDRAAYVDYSGSVIDSGGSGEGALFNKLSARTACYLDLSTVADMAITYGSYTLISKGHDHEYEWNGTVGENRRHTLVCANSDGLCKRLVKSEECTFVDGICTVCGAADPAGNLSLLTADDAALYFGSAAFRAVESTGNTVRMISDGLVAKNAAFDPTGTSNMYSNSSLKSVIESSVTLTPAEENAIRSRTLAGDQTCGMSCDGVSGPAVEAKLWAPTTKDAFKLNAAGLGAVGTNYWLCSPGSSNTTAAFVFYDGIIVENGSSVIGSTFGARAGFDLKLNSIALVSAAEGGKSGAVVGGDVLTDIAPASGNELKLTVTDPARTFALEKCETAGKDKIRITYSGAETGDNEYISYYVLDQSGAVTGYAKIAKPAQAGGTAEFDRPVLADGETLFIINEQANADRQTDYSCEPVKVTLPDSPAHQHIFPAEWVKTGTAHWHECTAEDCDIKDYSTCGIEEAAYGEHVGMDDFVCDICNYCDELAAAKADANAAIDSAAGAKQNKAVKQLVSEAKELIDKAETVEEVLRVQNDYCALIGKEAAPHIISVSVDKETVIRGENAVWTVVTAPSADYIRFVSDSGTLNFAKGMTNVEAAENEDENTVWTITTRMTYTDAAKLEVEQTFTLACRSSQSNVWNAADSEITVKVKKYDENNAVNSEDYAPYSIVSASAIGGKKLGFTPITVVTTKDVTKLRFTVGSKTVTYTETSANTTVTADPEDENLIIWTIGYRFTAAGDYTVKIESRGTTWNTEAAKAAVKIFATQSEADEYNKK